ncbi:hypothetical protein [Mesorhizobium sp.]|uniref:hypothetical protein n=1 Tax=Mesorhizobium sp. TaxID=1871066 RepID=UPI000FE7B18E|nr:hypothetical protein [Mesorhizobium sp.]RWO63083.1 MAG: hypothetical protein EOS14_00990 [Mesorhizobium sp.]
MTRNGKLRLPSLDNLDRRTAAYRDAMDLIDRVIGERGGRDQVDVVRAASAETWAVLTTQLRGMQVQWLNGGCVDWSEFTTIANARRREGETLGSPEARDITPTLSQYLADNYSEPAA